MSTENTDDSPTISDSEEDVCRGLPGPGIQSYQTMSGWVLQCVHHFWHAKEYIRKAWPDDIYLLLLGNQTICELNEFNNELVKKAQQQSCIETQDIETSDKMVSLFTISSSLFYTILDLDIEFIPDDDGLKKTLIKMLQEIDLILYVMCVHREFVWEGKLVHSDVNMTCPPRHKDDANRTCRPQQRIFWILQKIISNQIYKTQLQNMNMELQNTEYAVQLRNMGYDVQLQNIEYGVLHSVYHSVSRLGIASDNCNQEIYNRRLHVKLAYFYIMCGKIFSSMKDALAGNKDFAKDCNFLHEMIRQLLENYPESKFKSVVSINNEGAAKLQEYKDAVSNNALRVVNST